MQTGQETDFILVSCTGLGIEPTRREQVLKAKKVSPSFIFLFFLSFSFFCLFVHTVSVSFNFAHMTLVLSSYNSPGWGGFIEKIRPWIHNYSPWSPKGKVVIWDGGFMNWLWKANGHFFFFIWNNLHISFFIWNNLLYKIWLKEGK